MKRIPFDVIINHIIPYTYNVQSNTLLEDIKNYYTIKEILMNKKYDTNMIKHEILALFYDNKSKLSTILNRHFQMKCKKKDCDIIYNFSNNKRFNILFGLFTKEERILFLEYILQDKFFWTIK
jgi:hypothetical protein